MKKLILILTIAICLLINSNVFAKELEPRINIDTTRVFAFKFNKTIDIKSLENNIYVIDEKNEKAKIKFALDDSNKVMYIIPAAEYKEGTTYRMVFTTNIKTIDKKAYLKENVYMNFTTRINCPYSLDATQSQL